MRLYVIRSGAYSDKAWHAILSDKGKADALAKEMNLRKAGLYGVDGDPETYDVEKIWDKATVEEWELDELPTLQEGVYEVHIDVKGTVTGWEFHDWQTLVREPTFLGGEYIGFGRTVELARRSAEEYRRVDLTTPGVDSLR
jgi:hypothetical protein